MAGLFLIRDTGSPACDETIARATADYARQGFGEPTVLALPGWRGCHWSHTEGGPDTLLIDGDDLVAIAGTLVFDGLMGRPALTALLAATRGPTPDWSRVGGQFVALVRRGGRTFLFTDWFAAFQIFHDADRQLFSTALLAAVGALPRIRFDTQGLYEFAFNVTPLGDDTVFEGLSTLGPNVAIELTPAGTISHPLAKPLPTVPQAMPLGERIERHRARLDAIVGPHVRHYGDRIFCPLSGGIDSRLLLACLRRAGGDPDVYVYGSAGSADVEVALNIGSAMDFHVDWIDKAKTCAEPEEFPDIVQRNFLAFDGLPNFGNIFDTGGNIAARDARHAGGALASSGGCGEIYRNFFYLPDRPTSAEAVARAFFARFLASDATDLFDPRAYIERIRDKILDALELPHCDGALPRTVVEQIYPRVRCRALFGREISMENRLSPYLMPFLDHKVVAEAMTLPMALRSAGRFEAALLNEIDPALAALPSAYGHDFAGSPGRRHRLNEWSARMRPIWLRQRSYAIRRRLRPLSDEHGGMLGPDYLHRVLDPGFPVMRRYFQIDRITDSSLLRRIACLEYLAQQLGSRLAA